jgi:hypothetical protein
MIDRGGKTDRQYMALPVIYAVDVLRGCFPVSVQMLA